MDAQLGCRNEPESVAVGLMGKLGWSLAAGVDSEMEFKYVIMYFPGSHRDKHLEWRHRSKSRKNQCREMSKLNLLQAGNDVVH